MKMLHIYWLILFISYCNCCFMCKYLEMGYVTVFSSLHT